MLAQITVEGENVRLTLIFRTPLSSVLNIRIINPTYSRGPMRIARGEIVTKLGLTSTITPIAYVISAVSLLVGSLIAVSGKHLR